MIEGLPVLDAHIHLDPKGSNVEAVKRFLDSGGTHLMVIHKPYHHIPVRDIGGYRRSFETTIDLCGSARKAGAHAWCFIGPYPGELPHLAREIGLEGAFNLQVSAVEESLKIVEEGRAIGIGEVGRVHFDVESRVQEACDEVLQFVLRGAKEVGCPVVLHTESFHTNPGLMEHLATLMDRSAFPREKAIKHYSGPDLIDPASNLGISISMQCRKENLKILLGSEQDHLLETDFVDDPDRPNVVMPPETVPKKVRWAYQQGLLDNERHARLMIDLPRKVFGIETHS